MEICPAGAVIFVGMLIFTALGFSAAAVVW